MSPLWEERDMAQSLWEEELSNRATQQKRDSLYPQDIARKKLRMEGAQAYTKPARIENNILQALVKVKKVITLAEIINLAAVEDETPTGEGDEDSQVGKVG